MLYLSFKKLTSYLTSATCNLSNCNVSCKKNSFLNLEPKIPYLDVLGTNFEKELSNSSYGKVCCGNKNP